MPETSTPYTVLAHLDNGEVITSAQFKVDLPGEAIKEWSTKLARLDVFELRLVKGWVLIPADHVVYLTVRLDGNVSPLGRAV